MNNWLKYLVAVSAILVAGTAAYFSITGLGILFSGASVAVMVMTGSLEFAKLVSATYLKQRWDEIKGFNKWYLSSAVGILMLITSAGIFGYLSNAFQQQNIKLDQVSREIQVWQNKIDFTNQQITTLQSQSKDLTSTQNTLITKGNVNNRLLRSVDNRDKQSTAISKKINILQDSIVSYNGHINDVKNENINIEREVGGFRFVAEALGMTLNGVVKLFIFLIVIVFDPLAIALVIALNQLIMTERKDEESSPGELKDFVDETTRIHLTEKDLKVLEEALLNPKEPNEELKKAAEEYNRRGELLAEIMKNDEELGLYNEPFDNPLIKEPHHSPQNAEEMMLTTNSDIIESIPADDDVSDWDVTLMDGLEDEEPFFTEEEIENIFQEEPTEEEIQRNFSTIEPETENIFHNNEPVYQSDIKEIDEILKVANDVIDNDDEKKK